MSERRFGVRVRVSWGRFGDLGMAMVVVVMVMRLWNFRVARRKRPTTSTDTFNGFLRIRSVCIDLHIHKISG